MKTIIIVTALLLAACGGGSGDAAAPDDRETVFDPLTDQLDKAESVQDTTRQHKDDLDAALQTAEDDDEPL